MTVHIEIVKVHKEVTQIFIGNNTIKVCSSTSWTLYDRYKAC